MSATDTQTHPDNTFSDGSMIPSPLAHLTEEQIDELAKEFDAIHDEVYADLGEHDRRYITTMIELHRRLAVMSRVWLLASDFRIAWIIGTLTHSGTKILENMELGHNIMHGQWDWMNDPYIHSSNWDWDTASTAEAWKHSHNYVHHTFTNIRGKDKDLGYEIMRIDPHQPWHPAYLAQPVVNLLLMLLFEWGVAFHDLDFDAIRSGEKSKKEVFHQLKGMGVKARTQIVKDYIGWPAISAAAAGAADYAVKRDRTSALDRAKRTFRKTVTANVTANVARNIWAHGIIFCGHFPDQTYTFSAEECENESRGGWYVRQLVGAANIEGGNFFHVASGNLSFQVEHHLFPDMPSSRYQQISPKVRDICERYGLPYNTGPFWQQYGMVQRTILRLAFPGGKPRPKPGPYKAPEANGNGNPSASRLGAMPGQRVRDVNSGNRNSAANGKRESGPGQADPGVRVEMPGRG